MRYLLDTVALVRHFSKSGFIGRKANELLNNIENRNNGFLISVVSLMEVMYLAEKKRIGINLSETLDIIEASSNYEIVNLNSDIIRVAEYTPFYELHDRLILATARWLGIKVISSDSKFAFVDDIEVIWN